MSNSKKREPMSQEKKNLIFYPIGTIGRDAIYQLFANYLYTYALFTRQLTDAQLVAITAIMVGARIFDALNDPVMGNIIERTRTKWGKFKPWLLAGILSTAFVVIFIFNTNLQGWAFIWAFGICYFLYSITYTMNDISYWGMVPSLSEDANKRNQFTSRATLFAGIGGTMVTILVPMLTAGEKAIGGNAQTAYGIIAWVICISAPVFISFLLLGVKENRNYEKEEVPPVSFKKIISTFTGNDQLMWIALAFILQQVGNGIILGGIGSTFIYFDFGYDGAKYSLFSTVGMAATAILMVAYPAISRKINRKPLMRYMTIIAVIGYALMLIPGLMLPANNAKFWCLTIGYMLSNFGQYCFYLIMMISIFNTVEYNELKNGTRDEAIITSLRPFITKLGSALVVIITTLSYLIFGVTKYTNRISEIEQQSSMGNIEDEAKAAAIDAVITEVGKGQTDGLLIFMTIIPCVLMLGSYFIYKKKYKLDEDTYADIVKQLEARKQA